MKIEMEPDLQLLRMTKQFSHSLEHQITGVPVGSLWVCRDTTTAEISNGRCDVCKELDMIPPEAGLQ